MKTITLKDERKAAYVLGAVEDVKTRKTVGQRVLFDTIATNEETIAELTKALKRLYKEIDWMSCDALYNLKPKIDALLAENALPKPPEVTP